MPFASLPVHAFVDILTAIIMATQCCLLSMPVITVGQNIVLSTLTYRQTRKLSINDEYGEKPRFCDGRILEKKLGFGVSFGYCKSNNSTVSLDAQT